MKNTLSTVYHYLALVFVFFLLLFFSKAQPSVFMLELQSVKKEPDLLFAWI